MWAAVPKEAAHDVTRIWRVKKNPKNEEELSDLKELFLFTFGIVSWRRKKNLLHRKTEKKNFCYIKMRKHEKPMSFQIVLFCMQIISEVLISINA